jgi:hypothetical protein
MPLSSAHLRTIAVLSVRIILLELLLEVDDSLLAEAIPHRAV